MTRRHDIDALRAFAFALLMLYHLAMLYVADWGWHLKSSYTTDVLHLPMLFVNRWRMDLLFLISGMASAWMLRGIPVGQFVRRRLWRLLLPLGFGIVVVVPIQPYYEGLANGLVEPGFLQFLARYFTGYAWPANAFDGWQYGFTWNHLWYLPYLLMYTLLVASLQPALESRAGRWLRESFVDLAGWRLLAYPAVPLVGYTLALQPFFPATHALIGDWYLHAVYLTMFLYGWWLASSEAIWAELARLRGIALWSGLAVFAIYYGLVEMAPENPPFATVVPIWVLRNAFIWLALAAILGWGHAMLNRPLPWLGFANEAVYPWYVLHQSVIVGLAFWVVPLKLGAVLEPLVMLFATAAVCALLHVGVIRRIGFLRACFGMRPVTRPVPLDFRASQAGG